jgi:hypothetical protein
MQQTPFIIDMGRYPRMGFDPHQLQLKLESINEFTNQMTKGLEEAKDEYTMYHNH